VIPGRQQLQDGLRGSSYLGHRGGDVDVLMEKYLDHTIAVERLRLDVLDIAHTARSRCARSNRRLGGHVVRQKARVSPDHADDRDVDVGEYIRRRAHRRQRAKIAMSSDITMKV